MRRGAYLTAAPRFILRSFVVYASNRLPANKREEVNITSNTTHGKDTHLTIQLLDVVKHAHKALVKIRANNIPTLTQVGIYFSSQIPRALVAAMSSAHGLQLASRALVGPVSKTPTGRDAMAVSTDKYSRLMQLMPRVSGLSQQHLLKKSCLATQSHVAVLSTSESLAETMKPASNRHLMSLPRSPCQ